MTEEVSVSAPNPMEMVVTTNSAPDEQQSREMVTTEPKTDIDAVDPVEKKVESEPKETSADDRANEAARRAMEADIRAQDAERRAQEAKPQAKKFDGEPAIENYATIDEWKADLRDYWKQGHEAEFNSNLTAKQQQDQAVKQKAALQLKAQDSRAKHADFDQVIRPLAPVMDRIPVLSDFVAKSPMGLEVAYELGKQPALLETLRNADVWEAGEMLINMAARLKKPAVSVSNAPEPIKPVGSREAAKPRLSDLATKDINGFMKLRNKQELARKKAN